MFLASLDFSVNVALPEIAADLDADLQSVQWALVVFMGVRASLVLGAGSIADRFGLRRVFLWGGVAYLVSMFCIALSPDLASVVGFRVLHGIGTACMYAVGPAISANLFPPHRRGLSMGFTAGSLALGMVGGTIGAGLLVGAGWLDFDWEWVFWEGCPSWWRPWSWLGSSSTATLRCRQALPDQIRPEQIRPEAAPLTSPERSPWPGG